MKKIIFSFILIAIMIGSMLYLGAPKAKADGNEGEPFDCNIAMDMLSYPGDYADFLNDFYSEFGFTFTIDTVQTMAYDLLRINNCSI